MFLQDQININKEIFLKICREHSVRYLYGFGSSVTGDFNIKESDIDLVVEIDEKDPLTRGEKLISLWDSLESLFSRRVDLLTENSIRNPFLKENINATKILVYDGTG